jgi:hypothetical protein
VEFRQIASVSSVGEDLANTNNRGLASYTGLDVKMVISYKIINGNTPKSHRAFLISGVIVVPNLVS